MAFMTSGIYDEIHQEEECRHNRERHTRRMSRLPIELKLETGLDQIEI